MADHMLLARRPDHYRNFTVVGILLMALLGGIGGGVTRDVMVAEVPAALKNPAYITLCLAAGVVGYRIAFAKGQLFREGLFQFMTAFSLPWYAIAGAQKGVDVGLPVLGVLALAVVGPTAGRYYIDITSDGRPLLGRKLKGRSQHEPRDLGLLVEDPEALRTNGSRGE